MAKVYTIEELEAQVREFIARLQAVQMSLISVRQRRENMYKQGETITVMDTQIQADLDAIEGISDQIGAEITAMVFLNAIEIRVGLERKVASFGMDLNGGKIECFDDDGAEVDVLVDDHFNSADIIEVVGAETKDNSRLITLTGVGGDGGQFEFANISGATDNAEDTKAKIIMRDEA
jgi:hypothetical protein